MNKHYIIVTDQIINNKQSFLNQDKIKNTQKSKVILNNDNNNNPSPRTMKKEKSRDNFMKYHWPWIL